MKSSKTIDIVLFLLLFVILAADLCAYFLQKISISAALWTAVIAALIIGLVLWLKNYRNSAYGGQFHSRYPDSHN